MMLGRSTFLICILGMLPSLQSERLKVVLDDESNLDGVTDACTTCDEDVAFEATFGLEWKVWPAEPWANPITSFICSPHPVSSWWNASAAGDDVCEQTGLEMIDKESAKQAEKECRLRHEKMSGVAKGADEAKKMLISAGSTLWAWWKQMWRCGTCGMCKIMSKVWGFLSGLHAAWNWVVHKGRRYLLGHAHSDEIDLMKRRFEALRSNSIETFAHDNDTNRGAGALSDLGDFAHLSAEIDFEMYTETEEERKELKKAKAQGIDPAKFTNELMNRLASLSEDGRKKHLEFIRDTLQKYSLADMKRIVKQNMVGKISERVSVITRNLNTPAVFETPQCKKAIRALDAEHSVEVSLNVEWPTFHKTMWRSITAGPIAGILSVVPEVLVMAVPRAKTALKNEMMQDCLALINEDQTLYLNSCNEERPLMACVARTSQKLLDRVVFQEYWPSYERASPWDDDVRVQALKSFAEASEKSCLERKILAEEEHDVKDISNAGDMRYIQFGQFEKVQCPYIRGKIDSVEGTDATPGFSDKVWMASLWGLAGAVREDPLGSPRCPDVLPLATAYCSREFKCAEPTRQAFSENQTEVDMKRAEAAAQLAALYKEADKDGDGDLTDDEADQTVEEAFQKIKTNTTGLDDWQFLWQTVNVTFWNRWSYYRIEKAIDGQAPGHLDWGAASRNWKKVYTYLYEKLVRREKAYKRRIGSTDKPLYRVLRDISNVYDSVTCPRKGGGLAEVSIEKLAELGVDDQALATHKQVYPMALSSQKRDESGWIRLRAKVEQSSKGIFGAISRNVRWSQNPATKHFQKAAATHTCHCMCVCLGEGNTVASSNFHCPGISQNTGEVVHGGVIFMEQTKFYTRELGRWIHAGPTELRIHESGEGQGCPMLIWNSTQVPLNLLRADRPIYDEWKQGRAVIAACPPPDDMMSKEVNLKAMTFDLDLYLYQPQGK